MSTTQDIIRGFAVAAQAIAVSSGDPRVALPARGAAVILNMASKLLDKRSPEEVALVLKRILESGAQPIGQEELDGQTDAILRELADELAADETAR